jgi:hypothetical protein
MILRLLKVGGGSTLPPQNCRRQQFTLKSAASKSKHSARTVCCMLWPHANQLDPPKLSIWLRLLLQNAAAVLSVCLSHAGIAA